MSRAPYVPFDPFTPAQPSFAARPVVGATGYVVVPPPSPGAARPLYASQPQPAVGASLTLVYDKMRTIERTAQDLGPKIMTYSTDPRFLAAWQAWDAQWTAFYQKYQTATGKLEAMLMSSDLDRQTEEFRGQLLSFYDQYKAQSQASGQPVPPPVAPEPTPAQDAVPDAPNAPEKTAGWSLPWWFWLAAGVGVAGAGYAVYRYYVKAQATKRVIQREVLPGLIGPGLAHAAAAEGDPDPPSRGSRSVAGMPRLEDYAREADTQGMVYRPYEHPHLVAVRRSYAQDRAADRAYEKSMDRARDPHNHQYGFKETGLGSLSSFDGGDEYDEYDD